MNQVIQNERLQGVPIVSVDTLLYFNRIVIALSKKMSLFFKRIFERMLVKCLYGFNGGGGKRKLRRVGQGIHAQSYDGKEKRKEQEKKKERKGFLPPEETPKDDSGNDENDSHGQKDRTCSHPGDEKESSGKCPENGAEGREGVDLSDNIARLLKVVEGQLDDDRRDHSEKTGGDKKDDGGDQQNSCHQTRLKLSPAN